MQTRICPYLACLRHVLVKSARWSLGNIVRFLSLTRSMCDCWRAGPVRNGDLFEITFSSDNSINSTGFYATYHVINASMTTSPTNQPIAGKCKCPVGVVSAGTIRTRTKTRRCRSHWPVASTICDPACIHPSRSLDLDAPCGLRELWFFVRISPIRFLAGCRKRRLNQG